MTEDEWDDIRRGLEDQVRIISEDVRFPTPLPGTLARGIQISIEHRALLSVAVSLRRIADSLSR